MWMIKKLWSFLVAVVSITIVGGLVWSSNICKLKDIAGIRTFYLHSASSQAQQVSALRFEDIFSVKGESVRFARQGQTEQALVSDLLEKYNATLVFCEQVDGVASYYAVSNAFSSGVLINGCKVNLHVAVGERECVVGTPMIFGGF